MRRIVVSGAELNGFFSPGFDDHVKLFLPAPGAALVLPSVGERGMEFPTDGARPVARDFTPRHFDHASTELTIDVALPAHVPATSLAAPVTYGDRTRVVLCYLLSFCFFLSFLLFFIIIFFFFFFFF